VDDSLSDTAGLLAPGEEILTAVFAKFGTNYSKPRDTKRIAEEMRPDEIHEEIRTLIGKTLGLTTGASHGGS
jgi:hypothetical protein